jgi:diacylglycerol O-acyltransferase / wax synthase
LAELPRYCGAAANELMTTIERATPNDLMELASDSPVAPMHVAAILVLDQRIGATALLEALSDRVRAVPRLRQRLLETPAWLGRAIWVDDAEFDMARHFAVLTCPEPGDEHALLAAAAEISVQPLRRDRPLWSATLITDLSDNRSALMLVVHHVVADGIGGLAALAQLVDGSPPALSGPFPAPTPSRATLLADNATSLLRTIWSLPNTVRRTKAAVAELNTGRVGRAPKCSLNQPVGPRRALAVARADLEKLSAAAHRHQATINDVLLTAVTGALHVVLQHRGETVQSLVISVPISRRQETTATQLGNRVGVMPVDVPTSGEPIERLAAVAAATRARRKSQSRGASAALLAPVLRALAQIGIFRWFVNHQHLVNTFVTNIRGPERRLALLGAEITKVTAISSIAGNVTVAFTALSYAGTLAVTVVADPDHCPDHEHIAAELQNQLDALSR